MINKKNITKELNELQNPRRVYLESLLIENSNKY